MDSPVTAEQVGLSRPTDLIKYTSSISGLHAPDSAVFKRITKKLPDIPSIREEDGNIRQNLSTGLGLPVIRYFLSM